MTPRQFADRVLRWLTFPGNVRKGAAGTAEPPAVFLTGPDLVDRIVRAVELNQSVILSGPRGCGKSYCVGRAIDVAGERAVIPPGARRFLQGNREIPRDYMVEDEIAFRVARRADGSDQVTPYRRPSPLFAFAVRDPQTGDPQVDPVSRRVECVVDGAGGGQVPCDKYVLFLDEINRFSDGVLDALLSVLEERRAVLAGAEYELPVVVLMTMNPPGYDGSARKLSPPLAARIGRTYRLCSPDLDTLSDQIIPSKVDALRRRYEASPAGRAGPGFPAVPVETVRRVGLFTLLCWGDITRTKPGTEYLTPGTRALLRGVIAGDQIAAAAMADLAELCQFGPDGRAGSDWLINAIGVALTEAQRQGAARAVLRDDHLIGTVVESVSHKVYDSFSQAARPDLLARKERAVVTLCRQVFQRPLYARLVRRVIDLPGPTTPAGPRLETEFAAALPGVPFADLSGLFRRAGVTSDEAAGRWMGLAAGVTAATRPAALLEGLRAGGFLVPPDTLASPNLPAGFRTVADDNLARAVADGYGPGGRKLPLGVLLHALMNGPPVAVGPRRRPLDDELTDSAAVRAVGVPVFLAVCERHNYTEENGNRSRIFVVARYLDALWGVRVRRGREAEAVASYGADLGTITVGGQPAGVPVPVLLDLLHPMLAAVAADREAEVPAYARFVKLLRADFRRRQRAAAVGP